MELLPPWKYDRFHSMRTKRASSLLHAAASVRIKDGIGAMEKKILDEIKRREQPLESLMREQKRCKERRSPCYLHDTVQLFTSRFA